MNFSYRKIKNLIPISIRRRLLKIHYDYVFGNALKDMKVMVEKNTIDKKVLERLIYGWGNQGFSAQTDYLETCIEYSYSADKTILECGTGLSTIVVGVIAKKRGLRLISFEHNSEWAGRVEKVKKKLELNNVSINVKPLKNYGTYSWYDLENVEMPPDIGLVICDGPPAQTKGGRYGLIPLVSSSLNRGAVILMDDTIREDEKSVIEKWKSLISFNGLERGTHDPHVILRIQ